MRIAYGVHGYSRGHATRAWSVLSELANKHQVKVYAGADAYDTLSPHFDVERIRTLKFVYRADGRRSNVRTVVSNFTKVSDLLFRGPSLRRVARSLQAFNPDVVISDAEPWTHRAARMLGVPRIGFDHFGIMVYCKVPMPWMDQALSIFDRMLYRTLMGNPQRVLVSSFYDAEPVSSRVQVIGPMLRKEVHHIQPSDNGHLLVYFNQGAVQLTPQVLNALSGAGPEVRVYGCPRRGREGNIEFLPASNRPFLEDLASCRAVVSTAGNQLVGEAMYFGKPLLVMPERCVEQRLNAAAIRRMGIGEETTFDTLSATAIRRFLRHAPTYAANALALARDGRTEAVEQIDRWVHELPDLRRRGLLVEAPV